MNSNDSFVIDTPTAEKIFNCIKLAKQKKVVDAKRDFYLTSVKINNYSTLYYFSHFYVISYFNKLFLFKYKTFKFFNESVDLKEFIAMYSSYLILDDKLVPDKDFNNLKKCYMLTQNISHVDNEVFCSYTPYYMIKLQLKGDILTIFITNINAETEINMNNVDSDLKTFIKTVFEGVPEDKLKVYHKVLLFYATENQL